VEGAFQVRDAGNSFSFDEWFVVALARTIRDGEVTFHGFGSPCAQIAMHVAKRTHARGMMLVEGATYACNPDPPFIPPTSNDHSLQRGATYRMRFEEFFDAAARGDVDRMFLSGGQIDRYGNTNVTAIGTASYPTVLPKVKLGGGGGGCNLAATVKHLSLWTTRHRSGRVLVQQCDFITDMGHQTPAGSRTELGFSGHGPQWLVTELGIFDFDPEGMARLRQLFPDVTLNEVRAATGFTLSVAADLGFVRPPSSSELAALRGIDPLGVRRLEFSATELRRTFHPATSGRCGC
jgi:glutaconate CoA-transferase subunit B